METTEPAFEENINKKAAVAKTILTLEECKTLLGPDKVISLEEAVNAWVKLTDRNIVNKVPTIKYFRETIKKSRRENRYKKHPADWHLIFIPALSLKEQIKAVGYGPSDNPCFYQPSRWCEQAIESYWARQVPESGYYLINMQPTYLGYQPSARTRLFSTKVEPSLCQADPAIFTAAYLTRMLVKPESRLLLAPGFYHVGSTLSSDGRYIALGDYRDDNGLDVNTVPDQAPDKKEKDRHGTVVIRNFDY